MKSDAMLAYQRNEILRCIAPECRFTEMRILRKVALGLSMQISKIAAPATGNADLLSDFGAMVDQPYPAPTLARLDRTHQPGRTRTDDDHIKGMSHM